MSKHPPLVAALVVCLALSRPALAQEAVTDLTSQGAVEIERMFWASCISTPQLLIGERNPIPRKLSEVSARMVAGIASVSDAMMWLENDGTMCRPMMRILPTPSSLAAVMNSSSRSDRKRPRTTRASPVQPMTERMSVIPK